jgi:hypothetical protein
MTLKIPSTTYEGVAQAQPAALTPSFIKKQFLYVILPDANAAMTSDVSGWMGKLPAERNPALDITFDCGMLDSAKNNHFFNLAASMEGEWISVNIAVSPLVVTLSQHGSFNAGVYANGLLELTLSLLPSATYINFTEAVKANWVKWSDIGYLDFTVGKDNVSGERPLDWKGFVYCVKKLKNKVVVYGENGVSMLAPVGVVFGLESLHSVGLKGKNAIAGTNSEHYFVDSFGSLFSLTETTKKLDYSEYLSQLNASIVLSFDPESKLLYICDGVLGYIYNTSSGSFGEGPENITGIGHQSGTTYVTASSVITTAPFEICTDIFDLGTRAGKTIFSVELGTDLTTGLYVSVDWRRDKAGEFTQTPWYTVSAQGRAIVLAYGGEFRFRVKTTSYEYFELDYIKVNGVSNAY